MIRDAKKNQTSSLQVRVVSPKMIKMCVTCWLAWLVAGECIQIRQRQCQSMDLQLLQHHQLCRRWLQAANGRRRVRVARDEGRKEEIETSNRREKEETSRPSKRER